MQLLMIAVQLLKSAGFIFAASVTIATFALLLVSFAFYNIYFKKHKIQHTKDTPDERWLPSKVPYEIRNMFLLSISQSVTVFAREWLEANEYIIVDRTGVWSDPAVLRTVLFDFGIYFITFDIYYYFLHRFILHNKKLWWIHRPHHMSPTPNPFTTFSFNPVEVVLTEGWSLVLNFVMPLSHITVIVIPAFGFFMSMMQHSGYELFPRAAKAWPTKYFLGAMFHDVHHAKSSCNYGGFTTIWDHLFSTVHRDYYTMLDDLNARVESK